MSEQDGALTGDEAVQRSQGFDPVKGWAMDTNNLESYRMILMEELTRRKRDNPRYSLRAFARSIQVNPSTVSQIIRGRRSLSYEMAEKLVRVIGLSPAKREMFLKSVAASQGSRLMDRLQGLSNGYSANDLETIDLSFSAEDFPTVAAWIQVLKDHLSAQSRGSADQRIKISVENSKQ